MHAPRGRLLLILVGLCGTLGLSLWLLRELTRGPAPGGGPGDSSPSAARPVERLEVTPTRATQARVSPRFTGPPPSGLRLEVALAGGRPHQSVSLAPAGYFVLGGLEPGEEYHLRLDAGGQPVPGGEAEYRHPAAVAVAYSDFHTGEDYLRVSLQTWSAHQFRVIVENAKTGSVEAVHETTAPARRLWHVFPGLEPSTGYRVAVGLRDPGHFLPLVRRDLTTKSVRYREGVEVALQRLSMPIVHYMGIRDLTDYQDHKSVSRVVESLRSDFVRDPANIDTYRGLVLLVGWIGAPGSLQVLRTDIDQGPTPEHVYQAIVGYSQFGAEADYSLISSTMRKFFRDPAKGWSAWRNNSQCAEALVQIDRQRAADESLATTLDLKTRSLGERLVACLVLAQGMSARSAMGLAQLVRNDPDPRLRRLATGHLSHLGDAGRDELRQLLDDVEDGSLRARVILALGASGNADDTERVLPFLAPRVARDERLAAVLALGLLPDGAAAGRPLLEVLGRAEPGLAPFVVWALGQLGPAAAEALPSLEDLARAATPTRGMLPLALARIGGAREKQVLEGMAARPGNETEVTLDRAHALFALGMIGDAGSRERLEAVVKDPAAAMYEKGYAMQGLGMLGDPASAPPLLAVVRDPKEPELLRNLAMKSFALLEAPRQRETLLELLARFPAPDPIGLTLQQLLKDLVPGLRGGRAVFVPAFLPYLNTRLRVRAGEGFHSLRHGLWGPTLDLARVSDDRGTPSPHLHQARVMSLLFTAGRERYRDAPASLDRFEDIEDGPLFAVPNHPAVGKDEAWTYIPHFQVMEDAVGFMVVHLREVLD